MQFLAAKSLVRTLFRGAPPENRKRGKILRDASAGLGLLIVEGRQYPFSLSGLWKSTTPPHAGMVVEAEFDRGGELLAIRTVPEFEQ